VSFQLCDASGELRTHFLALETSSFLIDGTHNFSNCVLLAITQEKPPQKNEKLLEQVTKIARIGSWGT